MKILVVGSINMDLVTYVNLLPKQGETIFGNAFMQNPGGKGANQACAIGLLGGDVTMLGAIGDDSHGKVLKETLKKCNVKPVLKVSKKSTGCASIIIEEEIHDNRIIVSPGANDDLSVDDIDNNINLIKEADIIVSQLEIPLQTVCHLADQAKIYHKIFILNPAPGKILPDDLLINVTYLTPNETELSLISNIKINDEASFNGACKKLIDKGVSNLLVTLGSKGVYLYNKKEQKLIPAFKVKALDTTAAGDCFNGAFATSLANNYSLSNAILYAQKASSLCVQRKGAIMSLPKKEEIMF